MRDLQTVVQEDSWDNLIVLDAMRFDYMKEFYHIFPNLELGSLEKVVSPGSATPEVLPQIFDRERPEWQIISAHPFIKRNGGVPTNGVTEPEKWVARDYFSDITDLEEESDVGGLSVVTPSRVSKFVREMETSDRKTVIWMIQPHSPYIGTVKLSLSRFFPWGLVKDEEGKLSKDFIHLVRVAYKFNTLTALTAVSTMLGELDGTTVITADHGELLFDGGRIKDHYGHPHSSDNDILRQVPAITVPEKEPTLNLRKLKTEGFIRLAYRSVLDRKAGDEGVENYKNVIDEKETLHRGGLFEVLLHSDEYSERFHNPHRICGVADDIFGEMDVHSNSVESEDINTEQLRDLGYL